MLNGEPGLQEDVTDEQKSTSTSSSSEESKLKTRLFEEDLQADEICEICLKRFGTEMCNYSGRMFCSSCFDGKPHIIPARVLKKGDFTAKLVAGIYIEELRKLWNTFPVKLTPQLIRQHPAVGKYSKVKRQYLILRQVVLMSSFDPSNTLPQNSASSGSSEALSDNGDCGYTPHISFSVPVTSCFMSEMEGTADSCFSSRLSCQHDGPFKAFENLYWLRHNVDLFTMAEIYNVIFSKGFVDSIDAACKKVYHSMESCCLRLRRKSIGDRCDQDAKCYECQSLDHKRRRQRRKFSLIDIPVFSCRDDSSTICSGGITSRRVVGEKIQKSDKANSWLSTCGNVTQHYRNVMGTIPLLTLEEFRQRKANSS